MTFREALGGMLGVLLAYPLGCLIRLSPLPGLMVSFSLIVGVWALYAIRTPTDSNR